MDVHPMDPVMSSHSTSQYLHTKVHMHEDQKANVAVPVVYILY